MGWLKPWHKAAVSLSPLDEKRPRRKSKSLEAPAEADYLATMVIAYYSDAMAIAKVEQRSEPLRQCAKELDRLR